MRHGIPMTTAGLLGIAALTVGGTFGTAAGHQAATMHDVLLTSELGVGTALILGPGSSPDATSSYMDAIAMNYLEPMGFSGDTVAVHAPFDILFENYSGVPKIADALVAAVQQQFADGDFSAENPLVIVGYSASAVAASMAMQQLHEDGIPQDELHFVLLGNTAADDGVLANIMASLPANLQRLALQILGWMGLDNLVGFHTPDDLYPTTEFALTGDGFVNWPLTAGTDPSALSAAVIGMFSTHLEYMGLNQDQIAAALRDAQDESNDSLVNVVTIDSAEFNPTELLWNAMVNMGLIPDWLNDVATGLFD